MQRINPKDDRLPFQQSPKYAVIIYVKRLGIFFAIVLINLLILWYLSLTPTVKLGVGAGVVVYVVVWGNKSRFDKLFMIISGDQNSIIGTAHVFFIEIAQSTNSLGITIRDFINNSAIKKTSDLIDTIALNLKKFDEVVGRHVGSVNNDVFGKKWGKLSWGVVFVPIYSLILNVFRIVPWIFVLLFRLLDIVLNVLGFIVGVLVTILSFVLEKIFVILASLVKLIRIIIEVIYLIVNLLVSPARKLLKIEDSEYKSSQPPE